VCSSLGPFPLTLCETPGAGQVEPPVRRHGAASKQGHGYNPDRGPTRPRTNESITSRGRSACSRTCHRHRGRRAVQSRLTRALHSSALGQTPGAQQKHTQLLDHAARLDRTDRGPCSTKKTEPAGNSIELRRPREGQNEVEQTMRLVQRKD